MNNFNRPYSSREKFKAIKLLETESYKYVAEKYKCSVQTLYRWKKLFDGTLESLENGSHISHTPNPKTMPKDEYDRLVLLINDYPYASDKEIAEMLGTNRNPVTIYRKRRKILNTYKPKNKNDIDCLFDDDSINIHNSKDFYIDNKTCYLLELSGTGLFVGKDTSWPAFFTPFYSIALKFYSYEEALGFIKKTNKKTKHNLEIRCFEK